MLYFGPYCFDSVYDYQQYVACDMTFIDSYSLSKALVLVIFSLNCIFMSLRDLLQKGPNNIPSSKYPTNVFKL